MKLTIKGISIRNFRSIAKLDIDNHSSFLIFCGANNVGKTNVLRALKLFFEASTTSFNPEDDIPYHIYTGTRGAGNKCTIKVSFNEQGAKEVVTIEQTYMELEGNKSVTFKGLKDNKSLTTEEILDILNGFQYFLIEASNVDLPKLIATVVNDDILPIGLRRRSSTQIESLVKLQDFIDLSKKAVNRIESEITKLLLTFMSNIEAIDTTNWKLRIMFPEYSYLREAISNMITFTLYDSNDKQLEAKGSGIQRLVLLSLINYIKSHSKKDVIWAIDEPEAFLQPGLQKGLYKELSEISNNNQIIITTHSNFFIKIHDLRNTYLLVGNKEIKEYKRKPGTMFYKLNTEKYVATEHELTQAIKKHLGIERNDSWEIQPFNIVVEGKEDKDYLIALLRCANLTIPNIISGYGVDKYAGLFVWIEEFCTELKYKPVVLALFDRDSNGRSKYNSFANKKYKNFTLEVKYIDRYDGSSFNDIELEDFILPELLFAALNKFLKKRKYKALGTRDIAKRDLTAYRDMPVLNFITDMIKQNNEDKPILDFNDQGLKYVLSEYVLDVIGKHESMPNLLSKYPSVKTFLKTLRLSSQ